MPEQTRDRAPDGGIRSRTRALAVALGVAVVALGAAISVAPQLTFPTSFTSAAGVTSVVAANWDW